eukprot:5647960-Alexandrium_andersonii.AAC.1
MNTQLEHTGANMTPVRRVMRSLNAERCNASMNPSSEFISIVRSSRTSKPTALMSCLRAATVTSPRPEKNSRRSSSSEWSRAPLDASSKTR